MSNITVITAADKNFEDFVNMCSDSSINVGYKTLIYDLGGLEKGIPFDGKVSTKNGAKIPSKPSMILDALGRVEEKDIIAWVDADAIIWNRFDEIFDYKFDIGVTLRKPKEKENDLPINAGVVFIRKNKRSIRFVKEWIELCSTGISDQQELNKLCQITSKDLNKTCIRRDVFVHAFPCDIYNNFYFKSPQLHAKIIHYKSKHRSWWPKRTTKKIPKNAAVSVRAANTQDRFDSQN